MKYNQFNNKEQEIKDLLLADAFGSILGLGLYTSVVNPLFIKMPESKGKNELERTLHFISMNIRKVLVIDSYTSHIV